MPISKKAALEQIDAALKPHDQLVKKYQNGQPKTDAEISIDFGEVSLRLKPTLDRLSPPGSAYLEIRKESTHALAGALMALRSGKGASPDAIAKKANELAKEKGYEAGFDAEAWNNLGIVLTELKRFDDAVESFRQAIDLNYLDAHYNVADLLESMGRGLHAHEHWQAYLRHEPHGPWSKYARSRMA